MEETQVITSAVSGREVEIPERFWVARGDDRYVRFGGLLDAAHRLGLESITTELLQVPKEANDNNCIFKATVKLSNGQSFSAHGDANPRNVNRSIAPHLRRMAETRAVARALRWACNIGSASIEEVEGGDARQQQQPRQRSQRPRQQQARQRSQQGQRPPRKTPPQATEEQKEYIWGMLEDTGQDPDKYPLTNLTQKSAQTWIAQLESQLGWENNDDIEPPDIEADVEDEDFDE